MSEEIFDRCERILELAASYPIGVHEATPPNSVVDAGLPPGVLELYRTFDGGTFFHGAVTIVPAAEVYYDNDRYLIGQFDGNDLSVATDGTVWCNDPYFDAPIREGTRIDKWLLGVLESQAVFVDREGEFVDDAYDEFGEISPVIESKAAALILKRDKRAPGPRWRQARALFAQSQTDAARDHLERLVKDWPDFWPGWAELAKISEFVGERKSARDEMIAAAEAAESTGYEAYYWNQVARLSWLVGDREQRVQAAAEALRYAPDLLQQNLTAAQESAEAGEAATALRLTELAAGLAPADLRVLDWLAKCRALAEQS